MELSRQTSDQGLLLFLLTIFLLTAANQATAGLSGAYSFDEGSGFSVTDVSGNGNTGTLIGPLRVGGKYNNGLTFDGFDDYVEIPNSPSLDIGGTGLTISFWANIASNNSGTDYVMVAKPWDNASMVDPYYQYAVEFDNNGDKSLKFYFGDTTDVLRGPFSMTPAVSTWTYVTFTYDGANVVGYLDGVLQFSTPANQIIASRGHSLRIGVDGAYAQVYTGLMDDLRIYDNALTQAQVQNDMVTPVGGNLPPDTTPPSDPANLVATPTSASQINLSWNASTDNVSVTGYQVERCTGITCNNFTQVAAPSANTYIDTGLSENTAYSYRVRAMDVAMNLSGYSNSASATTLFANADPIADLQPGHWYEVPNSHLRDHRVSPPDITQEHYEAIEGNSGFAGIMLAWSGAAYDTTRDRLIIWGGGHQDYGGNEIYVFDINMLAWQRLTLPSEGPFNQPELNDGRPASVHTYDGLDYLPPPIDRFYARGGGYYPTGNDSNLTWLFNFTSLQWEQKSNFPDGVVQNLSAYDTQTKLLYERGVNTLNVFDPSDGSWTFAGDNEPFSEGDLTADIDSGRQVMVAIGEGKGFVWDLTNTLINRSELAASGATEIQNASGPGFVYDSANDQFVAWSGGTDVYSLDMDTKVWTKHVAAVTNTVTPSNVSASGGTFGRFQYIPSKNAFIAVNSVDENVFIYRLTGGGTPDTTAPSTPTNLAATATSASQINLSWDAATDNVGVSGYHVERCTGITCNNFTQVAVPSASTYIDTGLSENTVYSYRVRATDAAMNLSGYSNSASVTTSTASQSLVFSAYPTSIISGGSSLLTWSSAQATSCTASGGWNGAKAVPGGSQLLTNINTATTFNLSCTSAGGTQIRAVTVNIGSAPSIATLDDERNTYLNWGWTWTTDKEPNFPGDASYYVSNPDIHSDTEGDDLWTYLMMYIRTGEQGYLDRANAWVDYFKNRYRGSAEYIIDDSFLLDHMYGWGLVSWDEHTNDSDALTEAENLAAEVENYWANRNPTPGVEAMSFWGARQGARHLLLATRVAEATGKQRWIDLRDQLIDLWLQSPDWDAARGMYFVGSITTDDVVGSVPDAYNNGARIQSAFMIGILTEAFAHAYRTTGNTDLRDRIIAMASYIDQYGLDPTFEYTGSYFGIVNNNVWHSYSNGGTTSTFWDPVYTTSLVNTLVRGYKYTGDISYRNRAIHFFNRGTKGIYGEPVLRAANDNEVHHFVDTVFSSASSNFYLEYNKGELQYTYLLFENGGIVHLDFDGDGLPNSIENILGTDLSNRDTDGDGLTDYFEVNADGDPLVYSAGVDTDPNNYDTDDDGFSDGAEITAGTDPLNNLSFLPDGDINMDGEVTVADFLLGQRILLGILSLTPQQLNHADVAPLVAGVPSPDGQFTLGDLLVLLRMNLSL